jgi:hypothetical protein
MQKLCKLPVFREKTAGKAAAAALNLLIFNFFYLTLYIWNNYERSGMEC